MQLFWLQEETSLFPFSIPAYFWHHWNKSALLLHSSFAVSLYHLQVPHLSLHLPLTSDIHNLTWTPLLASLLTVHPPSFKAPSFLSCYRSLSAAPTPPVPWPNPHPPTMPPPSLPPFFLSLHLFPHSLPPPFASLRAFFTLFWESHLMNYLLVHLSEECCCIPWPFTAERWMDDRWWFLKGKKCFNCVGTCQRSSASRARSLLTPS